MLRKTAYLLLYYIIALVLIGFFTLDNNFANSITIFTVLLLILFLGSYTRRKKGRTIEIAHLVKWGFPFLFFVLVNLVSNYERWYAPPIACLTSFLIGYLVLSRKPLVLAILLAPSLWFYAFLWYPQMNFIYSQNFSPNRTELSFDTREFLFLDEQGVDKTLELQGEVVLIETWNEFCANCFEAMRDLHPFLSELEKSRTNFRHIYLYARKELKKENRDIALTVFNNKKLPYDDLPILFDEKEQFMQKYLENAAFPAFLIIDQEGRLLSSFDGYASNFKTAYKSYLKKKIKKLSKN